MRLAIVICFRDEATFLPRLLSSLAAQSEPADALVLVDDGSVDGSTEIARGFADRHDGWQLFVRPRASESAPERDRLVQAPELQGFLVGVEHLGSDWDVVAKMDGDLELPPSLLAEIRQSLEDDPGLGIVGSYLSIESPTGPSREHNPPYHVRGPNKFYRRQCLEQISPLPAYLGWDTIDELRARHRGWRTAPIAISSGDILHLRPTGSHDGRLRAYRRWGWCAWGYGAHPLMVVAGTIRRVPAHPRGLGAANYLLGWAAAACRREPRVEPETRAYCRREEMARLRSGAGRLSAELATAARSARAPDRG